MVLFTFNFQCSVIREIQLKEIHISYENKELKFSITKNGTQVFKTEEPLIISTQETQGKAENFFMKVEGQVLKSVSGKFKYLFMEVGVNLDIFL